MYIKYTMGDFTYPNSSLYIKYTMGNFDAVPTGDGTFESKVTISDSYFNVFIRNTPSNSTVTLEESVNPSRDIKRYETESETLTDNVNTSLSISKSELSIVTLGESSSFLKLYPKQFGSTVELSEATSYNVYHSRGIANSNVVIVEQVISSINRTKVEVESISISDSASYYFAGFIKSYKTETLSISDSASYHIFAVTFKSELGTLTVSDNSYVLINKHWFSNTTLTLSEDINTYVNTTPISKSLELNLSIEELSGTSVKQYKTADPENLYLRYTSITLDSNSYFISSLFTSNIVKSSDLYLEGTVGNSAVADTLTHTTKIFYLQDKLLSGYRQNLHQQQTIPSNSVLDYDFIKDVTDKDFTILSGGPINLVVTDIIIPPYFGVQVLGFEVGDVLPAGGQVEFTVRALDNTGRGVVDDFFTIHFTSGQMIKIWVNITRELVWDLWIAPDRDSYTEAIEYKTRVFNSVNNVTSTEPLMERYKYSCKYTATATHTRKHRAFLNLFREGLSVPVAHPLWGQACRVISHVHDGAVVNCDTRGNDFIVGEKVFLFNVNDVDEYHKAYIVAITDYHLLLDRKLTTNVGDVVTPSFFGIAKGEIKTDYTVEGYAKLNIEVGAFLPYV